jgi:hypothetical protein
MKGMVMARTIERFTKSGDRPPVLVQTTVGLVLIALIVGV